jgi:hypothetical protein
VGPDDVKAACGDAREKLRGLDHEGELRALCETYKAGSIKAIERVVP